MLDYLPEPVMAEHVWNATWAEAATSQNAKRAEAAATILQPERLSGFCAC